MSDPHEELVEVPEADALEQRLPATSDEDEEQEVPPADPEVPEADALDQSRAVPVGDEYEDRL